MQSIVNNMSIANLKFIADIATVVALFIALIQLYFSRRTQKARNSIELLSWFDTDKMSRLLKEIENENKKLGVITDKEDILDLLYYLDTMCALIKQGGIQKRFFYQMNHDFTQIDTNSNVKEYNRIYGNRFPNLRMSYLIKHTDSTSAFHKISRIIAKLKKKAMSLFILVFVLNSVAVAQSIEETLAQINATVQELQSIEKVVGSKLLELSETNPLYSEQSKYESDKDYLARMTTAIPQKQQIRNSYTSSQVTRLSELRSRTFITSNLAITPLSYDANTEECQLRIVHHDYKHEYIKISVNIKKEYAQQVLERWNSVEKRGILTIDSDESVNLSQLILKDQLSGWMLSYDFEPYKLLSMGRIEQIVHSRDGTYLALSPGSSVYSTKDYNPVLDVGNWDRIDISPDNKYIAYAEGELLFLPKGYSGTLIEFSTQKEISSFNGGQSLSFSPDGKFLGMSIWSDGGSYISRVSKTVIFNIETDNMVYEFGGSGTCLFSPDARYFACAAGIYDMKTGVRLISSSGECYSFNCRENTVSISNMGDISIVDLGSKGIIAKHKGVASCFSDDGKFLAIVSDVTDIYDYPSMAHRATIKAHGPVSFSSDNLYIVIGGGVYRTNLFKKIQGSSEIVTAPPNLTAEVTFWEPSANQFLEALEVGKIKIVVNNSGQGNARGVVVNLTPVNIPGLSYSSSYIAEILAGHSVNLEIPIEAGIDLQDGIHTLDIIFNEANGFPPAPLKLTFSTRSYQKPQLIISDTGIIDTNQNGKIESGEMIQITIRIKNNGVGVASGAYAKFYTGDNVFLTDRYTKTQPLGDLLPGQTKDLLLEFFINERCANEIPLFCDLTEATDLAAVNKLRLPVMKSDQARPIAHVVVTGIEKSYSISDSTSLQIDVEKDIPYSKSENKDDFAVVLGLESYSSGIPRVLYALRDATWFREYALKTLGIPEQNIYYRVNESVTKNELDKVFGKGGWLDKRVQQNSRVYFYFCGHGIPSLADKSAFLLPYDGDPNYAELTAYPLVSIYNALASMKSSHNTVFLDACFTGISRENQALYATSRPVFISPEISSLPQNVSVLSAADWNQMSNAWPEKQHGLFTYFLLKGMQGAADTNEDRRITLAEIHAYLSAEVSKQAGRLDKEQRPQLNSQVPDSILLEFK